MTQRPNILFCFTDQQKATSLDLYQTECSAARATNLARIAHEGTLFDAAYCTYPLCVPSRISLMTGRYPHNSGFMGNRPFPGLDADSLPERLQSVGYRTYLAGKDHCFEKGKVSAHEKPPGVAKRYDRYFFGLHNNVQPKEVQDSLPDLVPYLLNTPELHTIWGATEAPWDSSQSLTKLLTDKAIEFMEDHRREYPEQPFFMHWGIPDPHEFYQAPYDVAAEFPLEDITLPPNWNADLSDRSEFVQFMRWYFSHGDRPPTEDDYRQVLRIYLAMCQLIDNQLGRLIDYLKDKNLWENTIIVFSSDHGDMAGELGQAHKWNGLYEGMVRIPLVIAAPGLALLKGHRSGDPVSLVDLAATLCELAGCEAPQGNQGTSLVPLLKGTGHRDYAFLESGIPGTPLTMADAQNFPTHKWHEPTRDAAPYDPPHRWTGRCYGVRDRRWKLLVRESQRNELYDLQNDPWETRNVADFPENQTVMLRLMNALTQHLLATGPNHRDCFMSDLDALYEPGQETPCRSRIHAPWDSTCAS